MTGTPGAPHWHGTGVLSLLAGLPGSPAPGLIPQAHFFAANAFQNNARGKPEADSVRILEALIELEKSGVHIVNMSLVGPSDPLVHDQIRRMAANKGVVFVAAVGNGGPGAPKGYPAAYPEVIAVTAIDRAGANYDHASRGAYVDVAAPGVRVWAALPGGKAGPQTGTSFATPFVTAVVATVYKSAVAGVDLSVDEAAAPKAAVLDRLFAGKRTRDPLLGRGLIRAPEKCGGDDSHLMAQRPSRIKPTAAAPAQREPIVATGASGWETSIAGTEQPHAPAPKRAAQDGWAVSTTVTRTSLPPVR
jgi:subtilisin family serine protease